MGTHLRLFYDRLTDRITPTVTSAVTGFEAWRASDGHRHTMWQATSTATQDWVWDAGSGNTETPGAVAIARADLLVAAGVTLTVSHSTDGISYSDYFTEALDAGDLFAPTSRDFIREFTGSAKRYHRVRLSGASSAPMLAGLQLGSIVEVAKQPIYPAQSSETRAMRGRGLTLTFDRLSETQINALLDYIVAVSPAYPLDNPVDAGLGIPVGGRAHWLYDPTGNLLRAAGTPQLLQVILLNPGEIGATFAFVGNYAPTAACQYRELLP